MRLPVEAQQLVDETLNAARLPARDRDAVRLELECHVLDALDAGVELSEVVARYGDPGLTASLIRRAKRRGARGKRILVTVAGAAACYMVAVLGVQTAPALDSARELEREAASVVELVSSAQSRLRSRTGIWDAYRVALSLRSRRTLWSETESLVLLDRVMIAGDALLSPPERARLIDSLRAAAMREPLTPRLDVIEPMMTSLIRRVYGVNGRIDRAGLRLLQRTKGVPNPSLSALFLEPFYFATPKSRNEVQHLVQRIVNGRVRDAERAGHRLAARL
jgi:hypothetical protein